MYKSLSIALSLVAAVAPNAAAQSCDLDGKTITAAITVCNDGASVQGVGQCESGRDTIRVSRQTIHAEETCTGSSLQFEMNKRLDMSNDRNYLLRQYGSLMSIGATPISFLESKFEGEYLTLSQDTEFYYRPRGNALIAKMRNYRKIKITSCNTCEILELEVSMNLFIGGEEQVNYRLKSSPVCRISNTN